MWDETVVGYLGRDISEDEIKKHLAKAGLGSLLRRLFFKSERELSDELGLTEEQTRGLMASKLDLNEELAIKLGRILGLTPDVFFQNPNRTRF